MSIAYIIEQQQQQEKHKHYQQKQQQRQHQNYTILTKFKQKMLLSRSTSLKLEDATKSAADALVNEQKNMKNNYKQRNFKDICCKLCGNYTKIVQTQHIFNCEGLQSRHESDFKCNKCCHITRSASVESIAEETDDMGEQDEVDDQATDRSGLEDEDQAEIDISMDNVDVIESAVERTMDAEGQESDADVHVETIRRMTNVEEEKESSNTILKDTSTKPILKFSVSAILGETREGVRVRNGKYLNNLLANFVRNYSDIIVAVFLN